MDKLKDFKIPSHAKIRNGVSPHEDKFVTVTYGFAVTKSFMPV